MNLHNRISNSKLYTSDAFKSQYWLDSTVYSEQTPLLAENIETLLAKLTKYSHTYDTLDDYFENCKFKSHAPQVVGLEGPDHWIAVEKNGNTYSFIDSSGAPTAAYYSEVEGLPKNFILTEEGKIRQSPYANSCGLYAVFYCIGHQLYDTPYFYWDAYAHRIVNYHPFTLTEWRKAYQNPATDYWLHLNDIGMFNMYKMLLDEY